MDNKIQNGFILLIVIALIGLMSLFGIAFIQLSHQSYSVSQQHLIQARARLIAPGGIDYYLSQYRQNLINPPKKAIPVGEGTYAHQGDICAINGQDNSNAININDALGSILPIGEQHLAHAIDPYQIDTAGMNVKYSALANLRLRRILNAYGDVHRFVDHVFDNDHNNVSNYYGPSYGLPQPTVFSIEKNMSSDAMPGKDMAYLHPNGIPIENHVFQIMDLNRNLGLGDQIIMNRPGAGYTHLNEIKDIVNAWSENEQININDDYLKGKSFFELIKDDLTVSSFTERFDMFYLEYFATSYALDQESEGDFIPIDLQAHWSNQFLLGSGTLFSQTLVSPINLNQASFFVKAAIFYAPTNVAYLAEGATTIAPYIKQDPHDPNEYLSEHTARESMIASPSIGIIFPIFDPNKKDIENGNLGVGRSTHLMSLRDAMHLALAYEKFTAPDKANPTPIANFDDFHTFLLWHQENGYQNINGQLIPPYERAWPIKQANGTPTYPLTDGIDFNAGGLFHVAPYDPQATAQGVFTQDYIAQTLPHILSCIRRIPGYLGAPAALMSPYMVLKPDSNREDYKHNQLCRQGWRKIEDFVHRINHPKVCFLPTGHVSVESHGQIFNENNELLATSTVTVEAKVFETNYYRSQKDFFDITIQSYDTSESVRTHENILFGPNIDQDDHGHVTGEPDQVLGVVGLKDFDDDLTYDPFMTYGVDQKGYRPQIIMNFDYDDINFIKDSKGRDIIKQYGFMNTSQQAINPEFVFSEYFEEDLQADIWIDALDSDDYPFGFNDESISMEGAVRNSYLANPSGVDFYESDLSPFNGAFFHSMRHGEFSSGNTDYEDSLYWRLDPWLDAAPGRSVGEIFSKGIMTFWFRVPSGYDYPTVINPSGNHEITPESFSRVIANLHLWERYQFQPGSPPSNELARPLSITVGLRKNMFGLNIFARYDSGGEHHDGSATKLFQGPEGDINSLISSPFDIVADDQFDYMGFWTSVETKPLNYLNYRRIAHRSYEVFLPFANKAECGPGSWHRVSVYWNLGWDADGAMTGKEQLFIDLHDHDNAQGLHRIREGVFLAPDGHTPGNFYDYPRDDFINPQDGASVGFTFPFNNSMILSLGEAHARRLNSYTITIDENDGFGGNRKKDVSNNANVIYPFWRFDSCIDNFRLSMGPHAFPFPEDYFQEDFVSKSVQDNLYCALRYEVTHQDHGFETTVEPSWVIKPPITRGSEILSIGARIYYPPDENNNTPYVALSSSNDFAQNPASAHYVSQNEQNFFYREFSVTENYRIKLQYKAFKPTLDGDLTNIEAEPLIYHTNDHVTMIPWIKEVSTRHIPPDYPEIIKWERD